MAKKGEAITEAQHEAARRAFFKRYRPCCVADPAYARQGPKSYPRTILPSNLVQPTPIWLQLARERREREVRLYAGPHPRPEPEPVRLPVWVQVDEDRLTGSPATFVKAAKAAGLEVAARRAGDTVQVGVRAPHIRIAWTGGRFLTASVEDGAANVSLATYALTMTLREARKLVAAESAARAAKAAETKAAKAAA